MECEKNQVIIIYLIKNLKISNNFKLINNFSNLIMQFQILKN